MSAVGVIFGEGRYQFTCSEQDTDDTRGYYGHGYQLTYNYRKVFVPGVLTRDWFNLTSHLSIVSRGKTLRKICAVLLVIPLIGFFASSKSTHKKGFKFVAMLLGALPYVLALQDWFMAPPSRTLEQRKTAILQSFTKATRHIQKVAKAKEEQPENYKALLNYLSPLLSKKDSSLIGYPPELKEYQEFKDFERCVFQFINNEVFSEI